MGKVLRLAFLAAIFLIGLPVHAQNISVNGWCEDGGQQVLINGLLSTTTVQASYPSCLVTVFITGSGGTKATIYSNATGTPLSNPFTANTNAQWLFYVATGTYDVTLSGGGLPSTVTISAVSVGGGGGGAPNTSTFVTGANETATLPNSRQLVAGTNTTIDIGTAGQIKVNASGGAPGGSNTQVQFNNSGSFGGSSALTFGSNLLSHTETGTFNNTCNTYTQTILNGMNLCNEFQLGLVGFPNWNITQAIAGGCPAPISSTELWCTGVSGYASTSNTTTEAVGVTGFSRTTVSGGHGWGGNFAVTDCTAIDVSNNCTAHVPGNLIGAELDTEVTDTGSVAYGLYIGSFLNVSPGTGAGINISKSGTGLWPIGLNIPALVVTGDAISIGAESNNSTNPIDFHNGNSDCFAIKQAAGSNGAFQWYDCGINQDVNWTLHTGPFLELDSTFKDDAIVNAVTGFQVNGAATLNNCLVGNGTEFVSASCPGGGSSAPGGLVATDDFTRANSATLGANWTANGQNFQISSNVAYPNGMNSRFVHWSGSGTFNNGQYCEIQVTGTGSANYVGCGVAIASGSTDTGYGITFGAGDTMGPYLVKRVAGTQTVEVSCSGGGGYDGTAGDIIRLETTVDPADGDVNLRVLKNGVPMSTCSTPTLFTFKDTSSPISGGSPGLLGEGTATATDIGITYWRGGNI